MAKLTEEQARQLAELEALRDAPEDAPAARGENLNITIDLSDEAAVGRALKLGLLKASDLDDGDEDKDDDKDDDGKPAKDRTPKRRGYFEE